MKQNYFPLIDNRYALIVVCAVNMLCNACFHAGQVHHEDGIDYTIIDHSSFKESSTMSFKRTGLKLGMVQNIAIVDTFLICSDLMDAKVIHIYGMNSFYPLAEIVARGKGEGECLGVANIIVTNDKRFFWIYDITLSKLLKIDIFKAVSTKGYVPKEVYRLSSDVKGAKSPCMINDTLFAACSYHLRKPRYFYFSTTSKIIKYVGNLPVSPEDWPKENTAGFFGLKALAFSANLMKRPGGNALAVAYNKSDRIEIYKDDKINAVIEGPGPKDPIYSFKDEGNNISSPVESLNTVFTNLQVYASNDYIYSLYSGKDHFKTCGGAIRIFDWNGKPVRLINLDKDYCTITVKEMHKKATVYTVDPSTSELLYSEMPLPQ